MTETIGRLERVPLREVWPHEALSFTAWLRDNIFELNNVLGLDIQSPESEQYAGSFKVDIVGEDEDGPVVIENQLEQSDHDHLGKLLTYLTAFEAKKAIWIVKEPRAEHVAVMSWLNSESSTARFYLVKVEAVRIVTSAGEASPPAPLLTRIVGPSSDPQPKREIAERHTLRQSFWASLLELARQRSRLFNNVNPSKENWISAGAGKTGLGYLYRIRQHDADVGFFIARGRLEENHAVFDALYSARQTIEDAFGGPLEWLGRDDGRQTCEIKYSLHLGGYKDDEEEWPATQAEMVEVMSHLEAALAPQVSQLAI